MLSNESVVNATENGCEVESTNSVPLSAVLEDHGREVCTDDADSPPTGNDTSSEAEAAQVESNENTHTVKRKLPSWMLKSNESEGDGEQAGTSKRSKISTNCENSDGHTTQEQPVRDENPNQTPEDAESTNEAAPISNEVQPLEIRIKTEPEEEVGETQSDAQPSTSGTTNPVDVKPAVKVEKADASSTSRESCKFGIRCYRRNQMHRIEEAHPGDHDYKRPHYPPPPAGTPDCPFYNKCYRRNPVHFQYFSHPPDTDFAQNYKNHRMRLRQRQQRMDTSNSTNAQDEYDLDDPFIDDSDLDSDYTPSDDYNDDDDCADGDKAEE